MIVKNESAVIRRCLESVKPFISAWAISDTGSTDNTREIIREVLGDLPGVLLERPWVDFSTNRNEAIEAAGEFSPTYLLTLDADEELKPSPGFTLEGLTDDSYFAMFQIAGADVKWPRKCLFRPHLRYKYVLDEVLDEARPNCQVVPAMRILSYSDGARNSEGLVAKYNRDVEVLKRGIEAEPNCERYWFYLGQRLHGAGRYREALEAYERRVDMDGGFAEERAYAKFMIGQCMDVLGHDLDEVARIYREAWQMRPTRAEPLFAIACIYSVQEKHALAELFARAAHRIPRPADTLIVDESIYAWRSAHLLAGALAEQGKLAEARTILERLLELPQVPKEELENIRFNLGLIRQNQEPEALNAPALGPDEAAYAGQAERLKKDGFKAFRLMAVEYLNSFVAQSLPSPVRWLWIVLVAALGKWASFIGAALAGPATAITASNITGQQELAAAVAIAVAPLAVHIGWNRRFQDGLVAALTAGAIGAAALGDPLALGIAVFLLVAVKEAGVLALPAVAVAWWFSGAPWWQFGAAVTAAGAANVLALLALFGSTALPMLRAGAKGHATPYTRDNQRGAPHRLFVDLVLVSPITTVLGLFGNPWLVGIAGALVAAHALAPVRNVRLILAADLLLRASAGIAFGWYALLAIPFDVYVFRRLKNVYDPVTAALVSQLGMSKT
ncbi:MAG TPA: glycosyltransferase [Polyangiaceae bacterium]